MRKLQVLILSLSSVLLLTGCGGGSKKPDPTPVEPEKTNFEKALIAVSNFDIEKTNGFDFSLVQYLGRETVNSDIISLRADFSGEITAKKVESSKRLNEYGTGEQFTITEVTTYFHNNTIAEYKNNQWKWSNCKKSDYFGNAISNLNFDKSYLTSVKESLDSKYVLTADIADNKVKDFLGQEVSFSNVSIKLSISSDFKDFLSLEVSYFQEQTRSEMFFEVYRGSVTIELPN